MATVLDYYGVCNGSCTYKNEQNFNWYYGWSYYQYYSYCSYDTYYDCGRSIDKEHSYTSGIKNPDHTGPCVAQPGDCGVSRGSGETSGAWIISSLLFLLIIVSIIICAYCHHKTRVSSSAARNLANAEQFEAESPRGSMTDSHDADAPFLLPQAPPRLTLEAEHCVGQRQTM